MNKTYRIIWSMSRRDFVVVDEHVASRGKPSSTKKSSGLSALMLSLAGSIAFAAPPPEALPTGGQIVGGLAAGNIGVSGNAMTVNQHQQRMIANWDSFSIGGAASVHFQQPSASAVALNRVIGQAPSEIFGRLTANGQVMLVNPAGIVIGAGGQVNTAGLVASTLAISDADFMNGKLSFTNNGAVGGIFNHGRITTADGGVVAFISPVIKNTGEIDTPKGSTLLSAASAVDIDLAGDGLISYRVKVGAVNALIENSGGIQADGGMVVLSAKAPDALTQAVLNNSGVVRARSLQNRNGKIILDAGDAATGGQLLQSGSLDANGDAQGGHISLAAGQVVLNTGDVSATGAIGGAIDVNARNLIEAGRFDASGVTQGGDIRIAASGHMEQTTASSLKADAGQGAAGTIRLTAGADAWLSGSASASGLQGGDIAVTAPDLTIAGARLDASGRTGGGRIRVGGGWQGGDADLANAERTRMVDTQLDVSATENGNGGTAVVWSQTQTLFGGEILAKGGIAGGDGGAVEVSSHGQLGFGGTVDAGAPQGRNGRLLLDPKNIDIVSAVAGFSVLSLPDPTPSASEQFGSGAVVELLNGGVSIDRIVIASVNDSTAASNAGAVRLYNSQTGALIATLTGSVANDQVGVGVTALSNGNYVVRSNNWDNGAITNAGAVTWGNGTSGISGAVSSTNSLVGTTANDSVGNAGITALNNGNYVVRSSVWDNGAIINAGAVTWGNGTNGISGAVSSTNSLVGTTANDSVGSGGVTALSNGNYVVSSASWNNGTGAVTWGNGTSGISGAVSAANSLVGTTANDQVGIGGVTALSNGNYVVRSSNWDNGMATDAGAVTWGNGTSGISGAVSSANSLVGTTASDFVGSGGIIALSNGNYVVSSATWDNGAITQAGAVTWGNGTSGTSGTVSSANSLVGTTSGDLVGLTVTALSNGNYVVMSAAWDNGAITDAGAVTWRNGTSGTSGAVSAINSLVGTSVGDSVGGGGVTALSNGNYVVSSTSWDNGAIANAGAVTWGNGTGGTTGGLTAGSSLVGTTANDQVGIGGVTALSNGNYVVSSSGWDNGAIVNAGAVTWRNGTGSSSGTVSSANSLVGTTASDSVGNGGVTALSNGNYVVSSTNWNNGAITGAGAVTWGNGTSGVSGAVSSTNSLVGTTANDLVGTGVTALSNGNYVVRSTLWDNGAIANVGAVTWGNGTSGVSGAVSSTNSLVGTTASDQVGSGGIIALSDGRALVRSPLWDVPAPGAIADAGRVDILSISTSSPSDTFSTNPSANSTLLTSQITGVLNAGTNVVLQANNDITVTNAIAANNPGGNGGALTMQAGRSILVNANITTDNGNLTLIANEKAANGVVNAQRDAGAATVTMAAGTSINAGTGNVTIELRDGAGLTNSASGDISLRNITANTITAVNSGATAGSGVVLNGTLTATANSGDSIVLSGKKFINNVGAAALAVTGTGRWLVWSGSPSADTRGGLAYGFKQYDATYGSSPVLGSGNGFLYTIAPTITAGLTGTVTKTYDGTTTASVAAGNLSASGMLDSDTVTLGFTSGSYDNKNVGTGKSVTANGITINSAGNGAATVYGYQLGNTSASANIGTITKANLQVTGVTASNKVYDTTTAAAVSGGTVTALGSDTVSVDATGATGQFNDKNVGTGKTVAATGYALTGADASNYQVVAPTGVTADITKANLQVTGVTASNKVYDATTAAAVLGGSVTALGSDVVSVNATGATGQFTDKNVGTGKTVNATGYTLTGADANNYQVVAPTGVTANITKANLQVTSVTASNKVYDTTTTATIAGGSVTALGSDTVSVDATGATGQFADKHVGTGKAVNATGYTLTGADANNYQVVAPTGVTANITKANRQVTGVTASNKVYDTTTTATIAGGSVTALGSDTVSVDATGATGQFNDKDVGTGKAVNATGYTLTGADAGNYQVVAPTGVTANITKANLQVTGVTASNKVYDATTAAVVSGGMVTALGSDTASLDTTGATGQFNDKNVGTGKAVTATGYTLTGADANNYQVVAPTGLTANITKANLQVTGVTASNKVYDTTTAATIAGGTVTALGSDTVSLSSTAIAGQFADKNAGTGKTVTIAGSDYALAGADAGNYQLAGPTGVTANITKANLQVTGVTASNKVYDATTAATVSGGSVTALGSDTVSVDATGATGQFNDKNVGTGKAVNATGYTLTGTDANNYQVVAPTGVTANITKANLQVTGVTASNKVYDTTTTATIAGGSVTALGSDTVSVDATGATGQFNDKDVGTGKAVNATGYTLAGTDAGNYQVVAPTGVTANITKANLQVTGVTASNKVYDTTTGATITGGSVTALGSDTVSVDATGATGQFADKNVGTGKTVNATGYTLTGAGANNYQVAAPTGVTANITKANLQVTGVTASNKVYDATTAATIAGGSVTALGSDTVSVDATGATGQFTDKHVGTGKAVNATGYMLTGADAGNYQVVTPTGLTANITKANLQVTGVTASNKVYDATTTATVAGGTVTALGSDTVSVDATAVTGQFNDKHVGTGKAVNATGYTLTGTDAGNYQVVAPTGVAADIAKANLQVTGVTASNKVYDATTTATVAGGTVTALGSDVVSVDAAGATGQFADKHVGTGKAVNATGYTLTGTDAGNYQVIAPTGVTANITKADLQVTGVTASNKVYDATTVATIAGGTVTALGSDTVSVDATGATGQFNDKHVGTGKTVNATGYTLTGTDAGNYQVVAPTGLTANIAKANLQVTGVTASNKVYDTTTAATVAGGMVTALGSDTVSVDATAVTGQFNDKNVGTGKAVNATGYALTGADAGNYQVVAPTGLTANIAKANLQVTGVTASNKVYDATTTATIAGGTVTALGSDVVSVDAAGATGQFTDKNVGTGKTVNATGYTLAGTDAGNYQVVAPTGVTANITKANLQVTSVMASNKVYDATTTATIAGGTVTALGSDVVSVDATGATGQFADKHVGTGKVVTATGYTLTGADAGNYQVVTPTGLTANITKANLQVTGVTASNKVYDATTTATVAGGTVTALGSDTVSVDATGATGQFNDKNVGTGKAVTATGYTLTGADANNYQVVAPAGVTANIAKANLQVTGVTASNKVYDTTTTATVAGGMVTALGSDTVSVDATAVTGQFTDKNVGTGKAVTATGYTLTGTDANNYQVVAPTGVTANIAKANLQVTGVTASNKVYDTTTAATVAGGSVTALGSDTVSMDATVATGQFTDKNVGTGKAVTATGYTLTGTDANNYQVVAPTGVTANIAKANLQVTGVTASNKVYDATTVATVSGGTVTALGSDTVSVDATVATGQFADKHVGTGKAVTATGYTLTGADANNYQVVAPTGVTANITKANLQVTGVTASNKVYDTTTAATIAGGTVTALGSDTVSLSSTAIAGQFADKNAGTGKTVTIAGSDYALAGADAGNYQLAGPTGVTANITKASLQVTGASAASKTYDGTTSTQITGGAVTPLPGDAVTLDTSAAKGQFADKHVGTGKSVIAVTGYTLSGADAANYEADFIPSTLGANISKATLTVAAIDDIKVFDGTTSSSHVPVVSGLQAGDTVQATQVFDSSAVGAGKMLIANAAVDDGNGGGNYAVTFSNASNGAIVAVTPTPAPAPISTVVPIPTPAIMSPPTGAVSFIGGMGSSFLADMSGPSPLIAGIDDKGIWNRMNDTDAAGEAGRSASSDNRLDINVSDASTDTPSATSFTITRSDGSRENSSLITTGDGPVQFKTESRALAFRQEILVSVNGQAVGLYEVSADSGLVTVNRMPGIPMSSGSKAGSRTSGDLNVTMKNESTGNTLQYTIGMTNRQLKIAFDDHAMKEVFGPPRNESLLKMAIGHSVIDAKSRLNAEQIDAIDIEADSPTLISAMREWR